MMMPMLAGHGDDHLGDHVAVTILGKIDRRLMRDRRHRRHDEAQHHPAAQHHDDRHPFAEAPNGRVLSNRLIGHDVLPLVARRFSLRGVASKQAVAWFSKTILITVTQRVGANDKDR